MAEFKESDKGMRSGMATANQVADYILTKVDRTEGDSITHLKLQKLVYYCQAWFLAASDDDSALFAEPVQAWAHGPVVRTLWDRFKGRGWQGIDPTKLTCDPFETLTDDEREMIDEVWKAYGHLSGSQLRGLTHSEDPWRLARGNTPPGASCEAEITRESMIAFYRPQLAQ